MAGPAGGGRTPEHFDPLATATLAAGTRGAGGARVLIVDPDIRFGLLLKGFLAARGWTAEWVADGRKALRDWDTLRPHVIVTELQGEDLDGFEFMEAARRRSPEVPLVVCTRLAGAGTWSPAAQQALGIKGVLVRPLQFMELHSLLQRALA